MLLNTPFTTFRLAALGLAISLGAAAQTQVDLRTQGKNIDFSTAASTRPLRTGTQPPAACKPGDLFFKTDAPPGRNLYACTSTDVWTLESGGLPAAPGSPGAVLASDGAAAQWTTIGGDVTGSPAAVRVERVQGWRVAGAAPSDGQVLRWNGAAAQWEPQSALSLGANASFAFANQSSVSIPGAAHALGTANLIVECYDASVPNARLQPSNVLIDPASFDVMVSFASPQTGRCVVNGSGAAGQIAFQSNTFTAGASQTFLGTLDASAAERTAPVKTGTALPAACAVGDQFFKIDAAAGQNLYFCTSAGAWTQMRGGGNVESVFGRSGAVTAQTGDYNFAQIAGTVSDAQLAPGLDAAKIGAGTVNNTAFGYLAGVTSDIQSQLNGKAPAAHSHAFAGDLAGNSGSAVVRALQGRPVSPNAPSDGQALVWDAAANMWAPSSVAAGTTGAAAGVSDLRAERIDAVTLSIGRTCTPASPCNVRFGNVVYSYTSACNASISGGTGAAFIYVSSGGTLTIGHNLTVAAAGACQAQPNITAFPADSIPLAMWTAVNGTWDDAGGRDVRSFLSAKNVIAGPGIMTLESGGQTTISVDPAVVPAYAGGSAALNFGTIGPGACSPDLTFTVEGAVPGDAIAPGWPPALEPGLTGTMRVSAANTVAVRLCNLSGAAVDPVGATFRATVLGTF